MTKIKKMIDDIFYASEYIVTLERLNDTLLRREKIIRFYSSLFTLQSDN